MSSIWRYHPNRVVAKTNRLLLRARDTRQRQGFRRNLPLRRVGKVTIVPFFLTSWSI